MYTFYLLCYLIYIFWLYIIFSSMFAELKKLMLTYFTHCFLSSAHQNGGAKFSRAPHNQPSEMTYSSPQKQGRPPNAALPKLGSQKAPRAPAHNQYNQGNLDFLNVPDQGMSG